MDLKRLVDLIDIEDLSTSTFRPVHRVTSLLIGIGCPPRSDVTDNRFYRIGTCPPFRLSRRVEGFDLARWQQQRGPSARIDL
ncbi:hypothetical protein [Thauera humireducens]|uniref:hypothetical protein n=1 Tax=Thauera humireducens TaxID=1134435 RepID=UPI00311F324F